MKRAAEELLLGGGGGGDLELRCCEKKAMARPMVPRPAMMPAEMRARFRMLLGISGKSVEEKKEFSCRQQT